MRWTKRVNEAIVKGLRSWLHIEETSPIMIEIRETIDFEVNAIRNRIWFRGDSNELEQLYNQVNEYADKYKFWASKCSPGMELRKIHSGLPNLIIKTLSSIVVSGIGDFEFKDSQHQELWENIEQDNKFRKRLTKSLQEILFIGDGAFKLSFDDSVSKWPIIEFYPGERIEIVYNRGRVQEIIFKTPYKVGHKKYVLNEHYGYGYIMYKLYEGINNKEVDLSTVPALVGLQDVSFDKSFKMASLFRVYESNKWEGRGQSLFDGKLDSFDSFDEIWSQWNDALRAGRARTYIPESYIPRDPETGELLRSNPFDNRFIAGDDIMGEDGKNTILTEQPEIPSNDYLSAYVTALDLCLQGIISPSTLGIDVKKLDNAEAQREKEKTTLYSRMAIVEALQEALPELVGIAINAHNTMHNQPLQEIEVEIPFGEYANPSFESQVETLSKARPGVAVLSLEAQVEEMWGDSKDKDWKDEEVLRLKTEQGIVVADEPKVTDEPVMPPTEPDNQQSDPEPGE